MPRYSHRCKITANIPFPKTARLWLAWFSAASITSTGGKGSSREGQEEFRRRCTLIASPQFLVAARVVPICTKFISTTTRIQRLRPLLSGNDAYIKVKIFPLDRSGFEIGRNFCAAQVPFSRPYPHTRQRNCFVCGPNRLRGRNPASGRVRIWPLHQNCARVGWSRFSRSHILPPLRLTTAQGAVYTTLAGVAEFVPYDTTPSMGRGQASQLL